MDYKTYMVTSLLIFSNTFIFGFYINKFFENIQKQNPNINPFILGLIHLFFIINFTFISHKFHFDPNLETYSARLLYSTFLISLQPSMISNLKTIFH
jgi:hypothetical protein